MSNNTAAPPPRRGSAPSVTEEAPPAAGAQNEASEENKRTTAQRVADAFAGGQPAGPKTGAATAENVRARAAAAPPATEAASNGTPPADDRPPKGARGSRGAATPAPEPAPHPLGEDFQASLLDLMNQMTKTLGTLGKRAEELAGLKEAIGGTEARVLDALDAAKGEGGDALAALRTTMESSLGTAVLGIAQAAGGGVPQPFEYSPEDCFLLRTVAANLPPKTSEWLDEWSEALAAQVAKETSKFRPTAEEIAEMARRLHAVKYFEATANTDAGECVSNTYWEPR